MRPHRRQPTRLPCPWDSPGKNTGVGCHFLLQCVKVKSLSRVRPSATPWTAAHQAPPSMGFSRQEHWSGLPCLLQRFLYWQHIKWNASFPRPSAHMSETPVPLLMTFLPTQQLRLHCPTLMSHVIVLDVCIHIQPLSGLWGQKKRKKNTPNFKPAYIFWVDSVDFFQGVSL